MEIGAAVKPAATGRKDITTTVDNIYTITSSRKVRSAVKNQSFRDLDCRAPRDRGVLGLKRERGIEKTNHPGLM